MVFLFETLFKAADNVNNYLYMLPILGVQYVRFTPRNGNVDLFDSIYALRKEKGAECNWVCTDGRSCEFYS